MTKFKLCEKVVGNELPSLRIGVSKRLRKPVGGKYNGKRVPHTEYSHFPRGNEQYGDDWKAEIEELEGLLHERV